MNTKQKQKGFTLLELLIVIAIIGLLSSIVSASLVEARKKGRDAKRIADIKQLMNAMELYYSVNGQYPFTSGSTLINSGWVNSTDASWANLVAQLVPNFMSAVPVDPINNGGAWGANVGYYNYSVYSRSYGCDGQWYMIIYQLEAKNSPIYNSPGVRACDGTNFQYGNAAGGVITIGATGKN